MPRITIELIGKELNSQNWELVSKEYHNLDSELVVRCPEGHEVYSSWKKLRARLECPVCKNNRFAPDVMTVTPKIKGVPRTLALDQATHITGYSIFDGAQLTYYNSFEVSGADETERIHQLKIWLISAIENYKPDLIGIEGIQYEEHMGATTFQSLARLQGVIMDLCYELKIPLQIAPAATWRGHCKVKGKTRSDKKASMQRLVKEWFDVTVSDDCADAIGIGKFVSEAHQGQASIISWE